MGQTSHASSGTPPTPPRVAPSARSTATPTAPSSTTIASSSPSSLPSSAQASAPRAPSPGPPWPPERGLLRFQTPSARAKRAPVRPRVPLAAGRSCARRFLPAESGHFHHRVPLSGREPSHRRSSSQPSHPRPGHWNPKWPGPGAGARHDTVRARHRALVAVRGEGPTRSPVVRARAYDLADRLPWLPAPIQFREAVARRGDDVARQPGGLDELHLDTWAATLDIEKLLERARATASACSGGENSSLHATTANLGRQRSRRHHP